MAEQALTRFQQLWLDMERRGDTAARTLYAFGGPRKGWGVAALLDIRPAVPGHTIVFPWAAAAEVHELPRSARAAMTDVTDTLAVHLKEQLGAERMVHHIEGYGVPDHAHIALLPVQQRGESAALHGERALAEPQALEEMCGRLALGPEMAAELNMHLAPFANLAMHHEDVTPIY